MMSMFTVPFLLLPLLLGTIHFHLQSGLVFAWIPVLEEGPCRRQCEEVRDFYEKINGTGKDFHFRCDQHYDKKTRKASWKSCVLACPSCDPSICDEYVDENTFHCPPREVRGKCKDRCDANRPKGNISEYSFPCRKDISLDKHNCSTCHDCPNFVCAQTQKNNTNQIYNCPSVNVDGVCRKRCDSNRKLGDVDAFELKLKCNSTYPPDCQTDCDACGKFVCKRNLTSLHPDIKFYCSQAQLDDFDDCRELCDKFRQGSTKFYFDCQKEFSADECIKLCSKCPNYVCLNHRNLTFHCPPLDPNPFFPRKKSYRGKCRERCEKNRGGGIFSFKLNCESMYISEAEKNDCINICQNHCPEDSCPDGKTILCKPKDREARILEEEKEEEKNRIKREREKELQDLKDTIESYKTWIFVLVIMIMFASLASICGVIVAWRVFDIDGNQYERPDKHTSALGRLLLRRKKQGRVVPYVPLVQEETHASGREAGVAPVIIEG